MGKRRCSGNVHEFLLVEDFTPMGAAVSCLRCEKEYHIFEPEIEANYTPFIYTSHEGPNYDKAILVLDSTLE